MFRSLLRRASISDFLKATAQDRNPSIYNGKTPMDIDLREITNTQHPSLKPPSELTSNSSNVALKRHYKFFDLVIFSVCSVVGSGIYVVAGSAGKNISGAGLLISMILGLFSAGLSALCYGEYSSRFPIIGTSYTYVYISTGEPVAFPVGLLTTFNVICAASINAIAASGYLRSFLETVSTDIDKQDLEDTVWFGIEFPSTSIVSINIVAPLIVLLFTLMILCDIKIGATTMNIVAVWNILLLILFTAACLFMFEGDYIINPCEYNQVYSHESCPSDSSNSWLPFGFAGIAQASPIAFWAFAGAEQAALMAEESIDPTKDIPRAICVTLLVVFVLYEMIMLGLFGMVPFFSLDETAPLSEAFAVHDEITLQRICAFGAFSTLSLLLFAYIVGGSRQSYRMSLDGLLPPVLKKVHHETRTPFTSVLLFGTVSLLISLFFDLSDVLSFSSISTLINYTIVALGTLLIRYCPSSLEKLRSKDMSAGTDIQLTSFWSDMMIFKFIWSFFFVSLLGSFVAVNYDYFDDHGLMVLWIIIVVILAIIVLIQVVVIIYLDKKLPWKDWIDSKDTPLENLMFVPLSPYSQCLLIMFNCYMVASSGIIYFAQWLALVIFGIIIYISYGYKHSNMNPSRQSLL